MLVGRGIRLQLPKTVINVLSNPISEINIVSEPFEPPLQGSNVHFFSQLNYFDQIRMITKHPFFTGQCPNCKQKLALVSRSLGQCLCSTCGWADHDHTTAM